MTLVMGQPLEYVLFDYFRHRTPSSVGCQNITAKNQSLRGERSSTGTQHSSLLFKYQAGTSTPVSEQEPRHMSAPQYRSNCQEADIHAQTPVSPRARRLHHLGSNARIYIAQECT